MSAEFTVLEWGPLSAIKKKRRKVWQETGERILALPQKQGEIILKSRIHRSLIAHPEKRTTEQKPQEHPSPQPTNVR
jgi:hypothetical protein